MKQSKQPKHKPDALSVLQKDMRIPVNIFVCLMFSLFPLVVRDYTNITATKYVTFMVLSILIVITTVLAILLTVMDGNKWQKPTQGAWYFAPDLCLLLYIVAGLVSFFFSSYKALHNASGRSVFLFGSGRYDGFITMLLYIAVFWIVSRFGELKRWHIITCAATAVVMCIIGIIQMFGVNFLSLYANFLGGVTKFISTIGNMGMFSGMFCLFVPLFVAWYTLTNNSKLVGVLLLSAEFLSIYLLFELGVTASKVALIVMMAVLIPFLFRHATSLVKLMDVLAVLSASMGLSMMIKCTFVRRLSMTRIRFLSSSVFYALLGFALLFILTRFVLLLLNKKYPTRPVILRIVAIAVMVVFVLFLSFTNFSVNSVAENNQSGMSSRDELTEDIQNIMGGEATDASGSFRFGIWKNAWELGTEHWLFGTGIGTFMTTFEKHIAGTALADRLKTVDVAHNEYLQLFCTMGVFGLLAYLGFLLTLAIRAFKYAAEHPRVLILGCAVLGYCVQAFFSFNIVIVTPLLWVCAGLLYAEIRRIEQ